MYKNKNLPLKGLPSEIFFLGIFGIFVWFYLKAIKFNLFLLILFYPVVFLLWLFLFKKYSYVKKEILHQIEDYEEKVNLLVYESKKERKELEILEKSIIRYGKLTEIIEKINASLDLDTTADSLVKIAFSLVSEEKGNCLLYLVDKELNLKLFKSRKENKNTLIKAKKGDIFDFWVLKYRSPLWIEDAERDFRFDIEKLDHKDRIVGSLVSSPLMSQHRFIGILRLEHPRPGFFDQNDLRLLCILSDLGAVALENSQLFTQMQELAIHDSLTSLYTRSYFLEEADRYFRRVKKVFSLLMLDIDFFKHCNDKFGHTAGDIVLKELAKSILSVLKPYRVLVSRYGGEEFCIALPDVEKREALKIAEVLRKNIEERKIILRNREISVTVSIGVVGFPEDAKSLQDLIYKADMAMYRAKQKGRNQVCSF